MRQRTLIPVFACEGADTQGDFVKIDIFCHIFPQNFYDRMLAMSAKGAYLQKRVREIPVMVNLDARFRMMDRFDDYVQVISMAAPPLESLGSPQQTADLARLANDGMAELVLKHPDRFPGFIASLPLNDPGASVREAERAVLELGATGIQIFSNVNGKPLDDPAYLPLFEKMADIDLPIWLHPTRSAEFADYPNEPKSKYELWWVFGWPYETSIAMSRILFAGYFDRFPNLKIITHHMGAMIPYFAGRIGPGLDQLGARTEDENLALIGRKLKRRPIEYFRMFYADTALFGAREAMECGLSFFGADQTLFASDSPFDPEKGPGFIRETIRCIEEMDISSEDRKKIYEGNARRLLRLKLA
jgi:predicted TIM-barrel fold metal-dependent hydrolase